MKTPIITMRDFFALPEVVACQEVQKHNAYGTPKHREAFDRLVAIAARFNAAQFIGEY